MATSGDIFQVVLQGKIHDQTWVNAFYYRLMDPPSENHMSGLAAEFHNVVVDYMIDALTPATSFDQISVRNIFTGDELVTVPEVRNGARIVSSDPLPSFIAAHCKLIRGNNRVRHGHKYLVGLVELDMEGQMWRSSAMGWLAIMADKYKSSLSPGLVDTFSPVIVGRVQYTVPGTTRLAYRLPVSAAEMGDNWAYVTGATFTSDVTTMRSRKTGHGV